MAAATQTLSPGGALLRSSRLFAIPEPLPRVISKFEIGAFYGSDTGTTHYPLHQSITTPPTSQIRGDWGLKRPLPLRSTTKSSTPLIRVTALDTFEHITEFASAADHTLTLKKWQALHFALSTPTPKRNAVLRTPAHTPRSVFEEDSDFTAPRPTKVGDQPIRWKFEGPWLGGQTDLEFHEYVGKDVRRRKADFLAFLREEYVRGHNRAITETARDKGRMGDAVPGMLSPSDVTADQFNDYIRKLRHGRTELYRLIREFFDMPPAPFSIATSFPESGTAKGLELLPGDTAASHNPYAETGPPRTHPCAGLTYLRSAAHLANHALLGPQAERAPLLARLILPRNAAAGKFQEKLGVAGVVVDAPPTTPYGRSFRGGNLVRRGADASSADFAASLASMENIDPDRPGGTKLWVQPERANIDAEGKIFLGVALASERAVCVAQGKPFRAPANASFAHRASRGAGEREARSEGARHGRAAGNPLDDLVRAIAS